MLLRILTINKELINKNADFIGESLVLHIH